MDMPDDKDAPPTSKKTSTKPICVFFTWSFLSLESSSSLLVLLHCFHQSVEEADMRRVAFLPHMLKMQWLIFKAIPPTRPASPNGLYVKSRNDKQLRSKAAEGETTNCFPEDKTKDNQPIVPCGLIAWSLFNDTYKFSTNNKDLTVNKKNIAWGSDQRKLYGKIEVDLEVNDEIEIAIENNYNTYEFGGKKKLVLSTTTVMGGKNPFLGTAYLFVGGLSLLCAIGFILLYVIKPRPLGDPSYLPWNRNPGSIK
ncbi:hypothetical protein JHK87_038174 [Glycine soja]|nr:hypothetical protein JHK87_038174 [Glycine soja]